jgi:tRNA uridine 5-carboxymethylaminomethyl modification enzyme
MSNIFDVMVIGGGHSGVEAAYAVTGFDLSVCLISSPDSGLASAPCNPAVGGVGKGQVVRELDALGGLMGYFADSAGIQFRTLNESKGYAVQSTRVQIDKDLYSNIAEKFLSSVKNLTIVREMVVSIERLDFFKVTLSSGNEMFSKRLILTTGTFLDGKLHTGEEQVAGGRVDCGKSVSLSTLFKEKNLVGGRFKTGTPARLNKDSINYSVMDEQLSDTTTRNFSFRSHPFERNSKQISCFLTSTSKSALDTIRANRERSPIFNGQIKGVGPRYCPSIEDKAFRYPEKHEHHVFVEPEGLNLKTIYPNGISTSLPKEVQLEFIRAIPGLEQADIEVYGYAVEYDVVDTTLLDITLQCKEIPGLYFAGQVCGTSGYEEAAGQGIVAGLNAALSVLGREKLVLSRADTYIGVMIEDLVSNKRDEPYRLFTARSENRLTIREDNTVLRIAKYRKSLGLNKEIDNYIDSFTLEFELLYSLLESIMYYSNISTKQYFSELAYGPLESNVSLIELLKRPNLDPVKTLMAELLRNGISFNYDIVRAVAISAKYDGYINRANVETEKLSKLSAKKLNLDEILNSKNISFECRLRIERIMPETFGQLQKIEGIRPATLAFVAGNIL